MAARGFLPQPKQGRRRSEAIDGDMWKRMKGGEDVDGEENMAICMECECQRSTCRTFAFLTKTVRERDPKSNKEQYVVCLDKICEMNCRLAQSKGLYIPECQFVAVCKNYRDHALFVTIRNSEVANENIDISWLNRYGLKSSEIKLRMESAQGEERRFLEFATKLHQVLSSEE
jgi:hypothetical protein